MNNLKIMRQKHGISQAALSEKTNIPLRTIQHWEKGNTIKPDKAKKLADFFEVSVSYLLGYSSEPNVNFSPVKELKNDNAKVLKGKKIFQDYKSAETVIAFEKDVLSWYIEKNGDTDDGPTPAFFADNFINQVYLSISESQNFNNYISILLTDFFSLPCSEWDRIALMISAYSEKLNKIDED